MGKYRKKVYRYVKSHHQKAKQCQWYTLRKHSNVWKRQEQTNITFGKKSWLHSRNVPYHSLQKLLSPCLLSKKIKILKILILLTVLHGCKT